jgi:hypothetical protein
MTTNVEKLRQRIIDNTHYESDEVRLINDAESIRLVDYCGLNLYISQKYNSTYDITGSVDGFKVLFTNWDEQQIVSKLQDTHFFTKYKRLSRLQSYQQLYCEKV